jgi:hypothetical protein
MGQKANRGIDPADLEPGHTYQVDYKHVRLRRSFRAVGTYIGAEQRPPAEDEDEDGPVDTLVFEVKPRFGKPGRQPIDVSTIQAIVEP